MHREPRAAGALLLDELSYAMRSYLALGEVDHVLFALAVGVASHFQGEALWGLLVGPSSSGKTETIRVLDDVADEQLDEITAAGLLSWLPGKRPRPTGLLARRKGRVFATIADLSTLLDASDRGSREQLYSLLRRAYDGRVVREVGNAPEPLVWEGRLTLLAATTPAIDRFASHADALGPRWLYLRLAASDQTLRREASKKAREGAGTLAAHRCRVRGIASRLVREAVADAPSVRIGPLLGEELDDAAMVACLGRADVPRHGYGRREITGIASIEEPPRLVGQLEKLARALLALGLNEADTAALCRRAALDSMPRARRLCLGALTTGEASSEAQIVRHIGCNRSVVRDALEEFQAADVVTYEGAERGDDGRRGPWRLTDPEAPLIKRVFAARAVVEKSVSLPPNPPKGHEGTPHFSTTLEAAP